MTDRIAIFNERIKLLSGLFNSLGIALIILGFLRPLAEPEASIDLRLAGLGLALHAVCYYIMGYTRKGD